MATPPSTEASETRRRGRRRLIGAIALVVLAVVFVPMMLDSEPRPKPNEPSLEIPAKDKVAPLPPPSTSKPTSAAAPKGPTADVAPVKTGASSPKLEGFAVQVGAFRDEEKLKQAREKLAAAGIAHYVERRASGSGELNRLRAGPFATREAADKALASVKAAALDGQVVPLP